MIRSTSILRALGATLVAAAFAACGGSPAPDASEAAAQATPKPDTTIKQIAREPLTAADFAGLDSTDLVMSLPWTENKVSRDSVPLAARASFRKVTTKGTEGFDRALFEFDATTAYPGYAVNRVPNGESLVCGADTTALDLGGSQVLLVRVEPARTSNGKTRWVRKGTRNLALERFKKAGVVCDDGRAVTWAAGLAEGKQVRVLELKSPPRLAVDVR